MTPSKARGIALKNIVTLSAMDVPDTMLLAAAILAGCSAQILIGSQLTLPGTLAYLVCAILLLVWGRRNSSQNFSFSNQLHLSARGEYIVLGLIVIFSIAARFSDLNTRIYGIDADETKWTVQSWYSTILLRNIGQFASVHFDYLPVDFWVRSIFLHIFGLNFISARIESAFLSLLSVVFLYLVIRLITSSSSTALLSALLFSFSFIELSVSHQALYGTPPATWALIGFFMLFTALRDRKLWQFQASGILLSLGMLTYETFYPSAVLALLYFLGTAVYEIKKKLSSVVDWVAPLILIAWPIATVYTILIQPNISRRQDHMLALLQNALGSGQGPLLGSIHFFWGNFLSVLKVTFSHIIWTDALINWSGPLINPFLLPFVVIGLIYNLRNVQRPHFIFIPLWYVFNIFSGPILLGAAWPRVMYLVTAPIMVWGAFGLWVAFATVRMFLSNSQLWVTTTVFLLLLLMIIGNDYYIFTHRLVDPEERQKRRELADVTSSTAKRDMTSLLLFPYIPNQHDAAELEGHIFPFSIAGARGLGLDAFNYFEQVSFDLLLQKLWQYKEESGLYVVFDKTAPSLKVEREELLKVTLNCYAPASLVQQGRYFDVYHFDRQTLQSPHCYSPLPPINDTPKDGARVTETKLAAFQWDTNRTATTSFEFTLQRKRENISWIEVEGNFQGEGWSPEGGLVLDFDGEGFILDNWQAKEAKYSYQNPQGGKYRVWVRYYKRITNDQQNFIDINGVTSEFARNGAPLNEWTWESAGIYELPSGSIPMAFMRSYAHDDEYAIFIDSIVITSDLSFKPDHEKDIWQDIISTDEINSGVSHFTLTEELPPGEYRWNVRIFNGNNLIDAYGHRGVESSFTHFIVP